MKNEKILHRRELDEDVEYLENEEELEKTLEEISKYIGRIVIEFNSLEDSISYCIKEIMSTSETGDDLIYVFLAEMGYSQKANTLINLYGQFIELFKKESLSSELNELEQKLKESATRRNYYAHANWAEISKSNYVLVKIKAKKKGVFHTYRRFDKEKMQEDLKFIESTHEALEIFEEKYNDFLQQ